MKKILYIILLFTMTSCATLLLNTALQKVGIYDDKIELQRYSRSEKELVFFPIQHIGTSDFYNDVKLKIDSLQNIGYYFYFEKIKPNVDSDDVLYRKFRKITGLSKCKEGYLENLDSVFGKKIKFKKELINQPEYEFLGLNSINSKNVDCDFAYLINYYESKYGQIILEDCDFETSIYDKTICPDDKKLNKEQSNDVLVESRNKIILEELDNEKRNKIAIIYGKGHLEGLSKGLLERGYVIDEK